MNYPANLRYTKEHEWARLDGKVLTIGITDHAQSALGDVVFVDLPKAGRALKAGETFGVVESIKAVSDLYSPLAGTVTESNAALSAEPALVNRAPHDQAWMIKIELENPNSFESLLDAAAYTQYVASLK